MDWYGPRRAVSLLHMGVSFCIRPCGLRNAISEAVPPRTISAKSVGQAKASIGFSPLELLFGRTLQGALHTATRVKLIHNQLKVTYRMFKFLF